MEVVESVFSYLEGTNCYCCDESAAIIREKVSQLPLDAVHLIGTGDYHYVSLFYLERISQPFRLVLFDNHPDDQKGTLMDGMLSCGSWVREARRFEMLRDSVWIRRVEDLALLDPSGLPLYLSVDLDVLDEKYASTNWDQGTMSLDELCCAIDTLKSRGSIIGVDICGGLTIEKGASSEDLAKNKAAEEALLNLFR